MNKKFKAFMKKYGYYMVAGCVVIALVLALSLTNFGKEDEIDSAPLDSDIVDVGTEVETFGNPIEGYVVLKGYSATELMHNVTLNQWESHKSVDLMSETCDDVFAALSGTVSSVSCTHGNGCVIVITHADGLETIYGSICDALVKVGDTVTKGQKIGTASQSAAFENHGKNYVRFQVKKDGKLVDPGDYIEIEKK